MVRALLLVLAFLLMIPTMATPVQAASPLKAAFVREGNLWIKVGGKEQRVADGQVYDPTWSYDGQFVAYRKNDNSIRVYDTVTKQNQMVQRERVQERLHETRWAPNADILAYLDGNMLDLVDFKSGASRGFKNVAGGIFRFSWLPDGSGFLASSAADMLPDGWTSPILFKIPLAGEYGQRKIERFFTLPHEMRMADVELTTYGTSAIKWSPDGKWIAFIVKPVGASISSDMNLLCVLDRQGNRLLPVDVILDEEDWFQWAPNRDELAYVAGQGRIHLPNVKHLKVRDFEQEKDSSLGTPLEAVTDFVWLDDSRLVIARDPQYASKQDPRQQRLTVLYQVEVKNSQRKQISTPPQGFADRRPTYLKKTDQIAWIRYNNRWADVWLAKSDGSGAKVYIAHIDYFSNCVFYESRP